jgi:5-methylcytosine-specific restriction endonuclease McrA
LFTTLRRRQDKRPEPPRWLKKRYKASHIENVSERHWVKIYWATPPWLNQVQIEEMRSIYLAAKPGEHVDHIVPLKSNLVCGLHVPWNLQILPERVNLQKSNNMWPGHPYENLELFDEIQSEMQQAQLPSQTKSAQAD